MVALCIFFAACEEMSALEPGIIDNVQIDIGASNIFSPEEIEAATELVTAHFINSFRGCELLSLRYDEEASDREIEISGRDTGTTIVLFSDLYVSRQAGSAGGTMPGGGPGLHPYWKWILHRDGDSWVLVNWGPV